MKLVSYLLVGFIHSFIHQWFYSTLLGCGRFYSVS
jgi:hypothetical protein